MINLSTDQITAWIRIALYWASGALVTRGVLTAGTSEAIAGGVVTMLTAGWTVWGNRIVAKINEVANFDVVEIVAVKNDATGKLVASQTADNVVTATAATKKLVDGAK